MHLRSRRVPVQTVIVPLVCLAHITTPQEHRSTRAQGNCQGKNFLIPKASQTKEKEPVGERMEVTINTDPPTVAKSPTNYKIFHGHNIAPSRNGNHTSNRWDFHSIPELIFAKLVCLATALSRVNIIHLTYNLINLHITEGGYLGWEPYKFRYFKHIRGNTFTTKSPVEGTI